MRGGTSKSLLRITVITTTALITTGIWELRRRSRCHNATQDVTALKRMIHKGTSEGIGRVRWVDDRAVTHRGLQSNSFGTAGPCGRDVGAALIWSGTVRMPRQHMSRQEVLCRWPKDSRTQAHRHMERQTKRMHRSSLILPAKLRRIWNLRTRRRQWRRMAHEVMNY